MTLNVVCPLDVILELVFGRHLLSYLERASFEAREQCRLLSNTKVCLSNVQQRVILEVHLVIRASATADYGDSPPK